MSETTPTPTPASIAAELADKIKRADDDCVTLNLSDAVRLLSAFASLTAAAITPSA